MKNKTIPTKVENILKEWCTHREHAIIEELQDGCTDYDWLNDLVADLNVISEYINIEPTTLNELKHLTK